MGDQPRSIVHQRDQIRLAQPGAHRHPGAVHHIPVPDVAGVLGHIRASLLGLARRAPRARQAMGLQQAVDRRTRQIILGHRSTAFEQTADRPDQAARVSRVWPRGWPPGARGRPSIAPGPSAAWGPAPQYRLGANRSTFDRLLAAIARWCGGLASGAVAPRAIRAGYEQRAQRKGHSFTPWRVTLIVTMAVHTPFSAVGAALGSLSIGITSKLLLVLL